MKLYSTKAKPSRLDNYCNRRIDASKLNLHVLDTSNRDIRKIFDFGDQYKDERRRVNYFSWNNLYNPGNLFIILSSVGKTGETVHGFIQFQLNPNESSSKEVWFCSISVRPMSRRSGVSTRLIKEMVKPLKAWMKRENRNNVGISTYTELGINYVKSNLEETLIKHKINFTLPNSRHDNEM